MSAPPTNELDWLTLCVWTEARGEAADGQAAVARVILNRRDARYASGGSVRGTVLWPGQFSAFYFEFADGAYHRVCHTQSEAAVRAGELYAQAVKAPQAWAAIRRVCDQVMRGVYAPLNPDYRKIAHDVVLYDNPTLSHPAWATPQAFICRIGQHAFYRAKVGPSVPSAPTSACPDDALFPAVPL